MNRIHSNRRIFLILSIAATLVFMGILCYMIVSNLGTHVDFNTDSDLGPGDILPGAGVIADSVVKDNEGSDRYLMKDTRVLLAEMKVKNPEQIEKLADFTVGNRINRSVSLYLADKTLDVFDEGTRDNKTLNDDIMFVRDVFGRLKQKIDNGEIKEPQLKQVVALATVTVRDRRVTTAELSRVCRVMNGELGLGIEQGRLNEVLENLRKGENRSQLKRIVQQEAGAITAGIMVNPVTRKMAVLCARQVFNQYKEKVYNRLPPQMDRAEMEALFNRALDQVSSNHLSQKEIAYLSSLGVTYMLDRQLTLEEARDWAEQVKSVLK